jgi:hypothetical protein
MANSHLYKWEFAILATSGGVNSPPEAPMFSFAERVHCWINSGLVFRLKNKSISQGLPYLGKALLYDSLHFFLNNLLLIISTVLLILFYNACFHILLRPFLLNQDSTIRAYLLTNSASNTVLGIVNNNGRGSKAA